jgi:hypothetical protein
LLHPESPPSLLPPAKPLVGSQLRKLQGKRDSEPQKPKVEARLGKKDKAPGKVKAKKKKAPQPTSLNSTGSGNSNG